MSWTMIPGGGAAVITGAASGIGLAIARRLVAAQIPVVMVDRDAGRLRDAREVALNGVVDAEVEIAALDVADSKAMDELADMAVRRFGRIGLLCNNAGVLGRPGWLWRQAVDDFVAVYSTNVFGLVNGIRSFVPKMIEENHGHVLNTCSRAGLTTSALIAPYCSSKHAAVALSECLAHDLKAIGSSVSVSVLCPGWVRTGFGPERAVDPVSEPKVNRWLERIRHSISQGLDPDEVAGLALEGVLAGRFYIITNPEDLGDLHARVAAIEQGTHAVGVRVDDART